VKDPLRYFPLDANSFLNDENVAKMNTGERGLYISMLCWQWHEGSVPDDPDELAPLLRVKPSEIKRAWPAVRERFTPRDDGRLTNRKLESVRDEVLGRYQKAKESGQRGGRASAASRKSDDGDESDEGPSRVPPTVPQGTVEAASKGAPTIKQTNKTNILNKTTTNAALGLVVELENIGVARERAEQLVRDFGDRVRVQLDALPNRRRVDDPAAYLIRAIEQNFTLPKARRKTCLSPDFSNDPRFGPPIRSSDGIPAVN
jgi:uncharacterized protein YdaU (DUF1376 family)